MHISPTVPLLAIGVSGLVVLGTGRAARTGQLDRQAVFSVYTLLGVLFLWLLTSAVLAFKGVYINETLLQFLPYFYVPFFPVIILFVGLAISPSLRAGLQGIIEHTPLHSLIFVQAIRIAAIGTIGKYVKGELPGHFILPVGIPDLLIGLSAVVLGFLVYRRRAVSRRLLIAWNVLGSLIFLPSVVLLHLSVPGPLRVFFEGPTTAEVFMFPMALVPTFLAPTFILLHAATIWKLVANK